MYVVSYGKARSNPFRIGTDVYARHVWQPTLEYFLPIQMCHVRVNESYRVWHDACHLDDARMAPVDHNHFDGYLQGPSTLTSFAPGEPVPGLNEGGWHDAGDDDLRVESQADTMHGLALAWEAFHVDYDDTTIDEKSRVVEIHQPDGKPDVLQQIEHGALTVVGGYRALGRFYRGMIVPTLRQYTHLGDFSSQTDGIVFDPKTAPASPPAVGTGLPGSPDDRWVFTEQNPRRELSAAAGLAASARALRGYDDALAAECLAIAKEIWDVTKEDSVPQRAVGEGPAERAHRPRGRAAPRHEGRALRRLPEGPARRDREERRPDGLGRRPRAAAVGDPAFTAAVTEAVKAYRAEVEKLEKKTPYGVPYEPAIWGAGWGIQQLRHGAVLPARRRSRRSSRRRACCTRSTSSSACTPDSNTASFVSGVGARSMTVGYGFNRADWGYLPGGSVSGTALIRPDFPELLEWPFLWQQTEYVLGGGTTDYLFLALAADRLLNEKP